MNIGRLLVIGITVLTVVIVVLITATLAYDMSRLARNSGDVLADFSNNIQSGNEQVFNNLEQDASKVKSQIEQIGTDSGNERLRNIGEEISGKITPIMDVSFGAARMVAATLLFEKRNAEAAGEVPSRERIEKYLRDLLIRENLQGIWCGWEPNQFDGLDAQFVGKEYRDEDAEVAEDGFVSEGCFLPWIYRNGGRVLQGVLDDWRTSDARYYMGAFESGLEFITDPSVDDGTEVATFCIPLKLNADAPDAKTIGVFGLDVRLDDLTTILKEYKPFGGFAMLVSPEGSIVYHPDESIARPKDEEGEPSFGLMEDMATLKETYDRIKRGDTTVYTSIGIGGKASKEEMLVVHKPITFGTDTRVWTIVVAAPKTTVMQSREDSLVAVSAMTGNMSEANTKIIADLKTQTEEDAKQFVSLSNKAMWRSSIVGFIVLIVAIVVGQVFARRVNRTILARDHWYQQVLDAVNSPITVVDMDMRLTFLNKAGRTLLRRELPDSLGRDYKDVWKDRIAANENAATLSEMQQSQKSMHKNRYANIDWEITTGFLERMRGGRIGMVEVCQDVTARENVLHIAAEVDQVVAKTVQQVAEIVQDSEEVQAGTNEQVKDLREITDDMKQMNEQTRQNADRAVNANHLTEEATGAAKQGQERMRQMIDSMNQISETSQNTQKVVKSIDEIAFQTNLLALNAAVEAARAGQHGKGFAVVAEEVRNLAARSAKAAQETADMISRSNQQVLSGVDIANQTSEALNSIAGHVAEASTLVGEIASASKEQAVGVERINTTLAAVDQVTQSNLNAASETAQTAQALNEAVGELSRMVSQFKS